MIHHACVNCGTELESPDTLAGEYETCPECGEAVRVPIESVLAGLSDIQGPRDSFLSSDTADSGSRLGPPSWRRYVGGILAYWVYWLTLWAGARAVGMQFALAEAREAADRGVIDSIWSYGFGDHYLLFLILFCTVAFVCAILTGAIARKRAGLIAGIGHIPVIALTAFLAYLHYTGQTVVESPVAWGIVLPLALIGSTVAAVAGGISGQESQNSGFSEQTILGVHPLHWLWIWLPVSTYAAAVIWSLVRFFAVQLATSGWNLLDGLRCMLCLLPVMAFLYPLYWMYQILSGDILAKEGVGLRILTFVGI